MAVFLSSIVPKILFLPRFAKRLIVLVLDVGLCVLATWIAFYLRLGEFVELGGNARWAVIVSVGVALPIFIKSGFYRAIFRHSGLPVLLSIARATVFYGVVYGLVFTVIGVQGYPPDDRYYPAYFTAANGCDLARDCLALAWRALSATPEANAAAKCADLWCGNSWAASARGAGAQSRDARRRVS